MAQGTLNAVQTLQAVIGLDVYTKAETNALLDLKADKSTTYTKTETDALLSEKANADSVYTKAEADALLDEKADADAVYTKTETDTLLSAKADKSTTLAGYGITDAYTKTQTDNLLNGKADADNVYTKAEIDTKIPNTVGSATKPTYVNGGVITECTYELNKTVPANAVFTDTTYSAGNGLNLNGTSFSAQAGTNVTVDGNGINVNGNGTVASADSGLISGGTAYTELRPTLDGTWVKNAQTTATNLQKLEGGIEYLYGLLSHQYDQLKKYINGNYYDYQTDSDSKYVKTVPQGAMPYASLEQIGGKTLVWNQLNDNANTSKTSGNLTIIKDDSNGTWTANGSETSVTTYNVSSAINYIAGHKYLLCGCPSGGSGSTYRLTATNLSVNDEGSGSIVTCNSSTSGYMRIVIFGGYTASNLVFIPQLFDLTLMYGSGNEPSTVAEFQQMFPAQYYQYSQGQLLSAGVTEVKSVGKNLLDLSNMIRGSSGYNLYNIPNTLEPNTTYTYTVAGTSDSINSKFGLFLATNNTQTGGDTVALTGYINNKSVTFTTPSNMADYPYLLLGGTPIHAVDNTTYTFQIEYGTTATPYSPYKEISTPIPAEIQALEGYGWSAGTVFNYIDFERKVFVKNVGAVTFDGSNDETWTAHTITNSDGSANLFRSSISDRKGGSIYLGGINVVCNGGYVLATNTSTGRLNLTVSGSGSLTGIDFVNNAYADATAWKNALSNNPITVYYPLATPQEIDISAYLTDDNLIEVESGGSLTFPNSNGDDYRIDVPSSETYMVDLQSALGE